MYVTVLKKIKRVRAYVRASSFIRFGASHFSMSRLVLGYSTYLLIERVFTRMSHHRPSRFLSDLTSCIGYCSNTRADISSQVFGFISRLTIISACQPFSKVPEFTLLHTASLPPLLSV